ncbi:hypothetical protein [Serinibacter salmoneus]|uniref:Integral membrane protein n=1 Tax=Serinibacter salmoneus TaxID=556530 RepID=A0A2A9CYI4_9MICO|nr:hypothetical protein [Serinibacter salmoneus]PFG19494.1 hypothetical protein ATL40_1058 [Serinibacter salmoneus]
MLLAIVLACAAAAVVGIWALVHAVTDRPVLGRQVPALVAAEVLLLVQAIVAGIQIAAGHRVADPVTLWGYLVTVALMFPIAFGWAFVERSRWSSVVLVVAGVAVLAMQMRVYQLWGA